VSRYQKGKTNLDFTEARDSEWQWHQLGHTQVCISLQTVNHTSTPPLKFFTGPSCRPTNRVKALKHYQGNKDKTCSVLYFCYRQKVTERRRTKQAAGDKQVVNRESECDPDSTSDMPATLHNQHSYNTTSNTPMILTCIITSLCTTYQKSNSLQKTPNTEQHNKVEK